MAVIISLILVLVVLILALGSQAYVHLRSRWLTGGAPLPRRVLFHQSAVTFEQRVMERIEAKGRHYTVPGPDVIRVHSSETNKLVGIVRCCESPLFVSPRLLLETVRIANGQGVKTIILATAERCGADIRQEAARHKIRLLVV